MKLILAGTGVVAFCTSALFSFFFVDLPSFALPEPTTQSRRTTAALGAPTAVASTGETTSIQVRGATLRVGTTANEVLNALQPGDLVGLDFTPDPTDLGGLLVTRHYNVDGQSFVLVMGRSHLLGPERIRRISTAAPQNEGKRSSQNPGRPF